MQIAAQADGISADGSVLSESGVEPGSREMVERWVRSRLEEGHDLESIKAMLQGTSTEQVEEQGVLIADATGASAALDAPIHALQEALDQGALDAVVTELIEAETLHRHRKGALAALELRRDVVRRAEVLSLSIPQLKATLATSTVDHELDALREQEADGRARVGALAALDERLYLVEQAAVLEGTLSDLDDRLAKGDLDAEVLRFLVDREQQGKNRSGALERLNAALA